MKRKEKDPLKKQLQIRKLIKKYPDFTYNSNNSIVCKICFHEITIIRSGNVEAHLNSKIHKKVMNQHFGQQKLEFPGREKFEINNLAKY